MTSRILVSVLLLGAMSAACGSDDDGGNGVPKPKVFPIAINTGVENPAAPGITYTVPVVAEDSKATFEVVGTCATVAPGAKGGQAIVTSKEPGECTLKVTNAGEVIEVRIFVKLYTAAAREMGAKFYADNKCGSMCHDVGAKPDNTPSAIAEHRDEPVMLNVVAGSDPDGNAVRDFHKFPGAPLGVCAYLRSLAPRGLPSANNLWDEGELDIQ
jgi:hypothetical protein